MSWSYKVSGVFIIIAAVGSGTGVNLAGAAPVDPKGYMENRRAHETEIKTSSHPNEPEAQPNNPSGQAEENRVPGHRATLLEQYYR